MIIDFHNHVFPDELAEKALAVLVTNIDNIFPPVHNGTVAGLLENMDRWDIDVAVVQPVVTKQSQMRSTNEWVRRIASERIISFGGLYPHTDNYKRDIDFIADLGLRGLKFHPEYQDFSIDDPKMFKIYDYAIQKGLILMFHAGVDPGMPPPCKSSPKQFAKIVDAMQGGVIVAAHFGGYEQWDDVERYLAGKDIYLDTAMGFEHYAQEQFLRIVGKHGADKVLFASDSPWSSAKTEIEHLKALPLSDEEKRDILGNNARRLLKI